MELRASFEVLALQCERGEFAAVGQRHRRLQRRIMADRVYSRDRAREFDVGEVDAGLDEVEYQRRGADLEVCSGLGEIGVADDHVESAVALGIGVRLVAGVDDAALERGLESDFDLDVVRALRELVAGFVAGLADADATRAGDDLTRGEEGREAPDDRGEWRVATHQVVLVGAVRRTLSVDVVLVQLQTRRAGHTRDVAGRRLHHPLARLVPDHRIERIGDLGGRVLGMRVVDVETRPVGEDHVRGADLVGVDDGCWSGPAPQIESAGIAQR